MTEVFLGNPPWSSPGYYGVRAGSRWPHLECQASRYMPFPFFLAYATALLEKHGFRVRLVDAIAEKIPNSVFIHKMINSGHDLIVLETSTPSFENDLQLVTQIRRMIGDEPKIALCGPNNLMISKEFLEGHSEIDYVLRGEYEETLLELVQSIDKQTSPHKIRGLNFRDDSGKTTVNPDRPLIKNLDSLPWPSRHQLPMMAYYDEAGGIPQPSAQLWASRGCAYMCIFCVWPQLVYGGANYRVRKPRDVVDEMAWLAETYEFRSFYFDDDTFNIGKSRMLAFCKELKERRLNLPWSIMARADTMDREILESMAAARLFSIKYGVESADQSILDGSGKNLDLSRVHDTVQITRDLGIQYHLTFTFGLPGETQETAMKTIELALKLNPNTVQFSICTPMPGSKYYDFLEEKGYLSQKGWDAYTGFNSAVVRTDALSERDLEAILEHANRAWNKHVWQRKSFAEKTQVMIRKWGNTILGRCFS